MEYTEPVAYEIRQARPEEFDEIGQLMVGVYAGLEGFPGPARQPRYFNLLRNVGEMTRNPTIELLVAVSSEKGLLGAIVFVGDMQFYGSAGSAPREPNAAGFRLLAVSPAARGLGIGKRLSLACLEKAREKGARAMVIHTTRTMQTAWDMYERMGFQRAADLDFRQGELDVFGFRLVF